MNTKEKYTKALIQKIRDEKYLYAALFHERNNGTYAVTVPDFPGCVGVGKTRHEAKDAAQEALTLWIKDLAEQGEEPPEASYMCIISVPKGGDTL